MYLEWIWWKVKNSSGSMEQICNDYNFSNVKYTASLIDATSNGKKFSFCSCNIYSMVYGFDNRFVADMNMNNRDGNIVFDTSIHSNESIRGIWRGDNCYFIQLAQSGYETIFALLVKGIEREMTRENVNNLRTRRKFLVMWIKCRK